VSVHKSAFIHETSIIDKGAIVGSDTKIWHWVHVSPKAKIGNNCSLGQNVFVGNNVLIGNNVKIQNNVSVYDSVCIEDDVFCGPSMVFTNVYNPRSEINRKNEFRKTIIRKGSTLGANCTIICGNEIGTYSFVAAGALVNTNVKPFALMIGVPAKHIGWMSAYGDKIKLPLYGKNKWECPHSGDIYELIENNLVRKKANTY